MTMPPTKKLLPDVVHPLIHPKTLILNLSGTLVDTQYVFGKGVNIRKRPGLANFLKKMSQHYEIVIFSDDDSMFIESVLPSLDPRQQMISGFFGRECMVWSKGRYIKDLKYLNRDARKVIVIDKNS
jgi:import inner membrane translocase subunit TIM50